MNAALRDALIQRLIAKSDPMRDSENSGMLHISTVLDVVREGFAAMTDEQGFRPIESAPKDGTPIVVGHLVRYLPYKPDGQRQMKADGRWQEWNGHGWSNIDWEPDEWRPAKAKPAAEAV